MQQQKSAHQWIGPILGLVTLMFASFARMPFPAAATLAVTVWTAYWWISEAVPMAVTGLIPMSVLPVLGVLSGADVAAAYGHPLILLLMGGFMLSRALTYSDTHRQLAVRILHVLRADSAQRLIWGFMITAALLSMWISNTATTLMLLPIALACIEGKVDAKVRATVILSIAYAASIGGIATPVGTPPNLILMGVYEEVTGNTVTFLQWMQYGVPLVALFIPLAAWIMTRGLPGKVEFDLPEKTDA